MLDESANLRIAPYLSELGHDVKSIVRDFPISQPDSDVLAIAYRENRILITHDRDFGELVFVKLQPHAGVILFRLGPSPLLETIIARLEDVLAEYTHEIDRFIVVTHHLIRVRGEHSPRPEGRHDRAGDHPGDSH